MNKLVLLLIVFTFSSAILAKKKYEYKKYERFDFEALDVEGNNSSPGDLSIGPRFKKKFRNKIPERKNFNRELKKAIDTVI